MTQLDTRRPSESQGMTSIRESLPLVLHLGPAMKRMSDREFYDFCQLNRELRMELTSDGDLIIMPPTGGETGRINFKLAVLFGKWVERDGTGIGFDSSTVFSLPGGSKRSPDVSWLRRKRWEKLTEQQRRMFSPVCPDFVLELRSCTDSLDMLRAKLGEYIENGARLGWLIDPLEKKVWIYRPGEDEKCLSDPETVSGDPELPGFVLDLGEIW